MTGASVELSLPRLPGRRAGAGLAFLLFLASGAVCPAGPAAAAFDPGPAWAVRGERSLHRIEPARHLSLIPLLDLGLDIAGTGPRGSLDVFLSPAEVAQLRALGFDPQPLESAPRGLHGAPASPAAPPGLGDYHTVSEAEGEMAAYAAAHPALTLLVTIGTSIEGLPIQAIKVSDNASIDEAEPEVLVVGCHHARELMSVELPLYLMRRLLDGYGADPTITQLVDGREIWIVPIVNPDGHAYVEDHANGQSDGWWRKNRRPNYDGSVGVDLNRNYGYQWGYDNSGSSGTPSSEVYRGAGPFSEPETAAIRDFMAAHAFTLSASFHSYGQLLLYPWGYEPTDTPDHAVFQAIGDSVAAQNGYRAGNPASGAIYLTNGDMDDWVYGDTATKPAAYGFTFEVNTYEQGGFAPSDALIGPTCDLNWGPLLTLLRYADVPRRILGPARGSKPVAAVGSGAASMAWSFPAPDPDNLPARHDVREIASRTVVADDAEAGLSNWDAPLFTWSTARGASGTHSFYSGSADSRTADLTGLAPLEVASAGDSLVVNAWWDLETFYDYWYAQASGDGGATWSSLPGNRATDDDPFGYNLGSGITGSSGGFLRCAFTLGGFAPGQQVLVRFRCITDGAVHGEGLYLDDLSPVAVHSGILLHDTGTAAPSLVLSPPPGSVTWYQARAVDAEGHAGPWSDVGIFDPAVTAVESSPPVLRDRIQVAGANPSGRAAAIALTLGAGQAGPYRVDVFDVNGRRVRGLARDVTDGRGGLRLVRWDGAGEDGRPLGSGVYFLRLTTVRGPVTSRITLLR